MYKTLLRGIGLYELLTGGFCAMQLTYVILLGGGGSLAALLLLALCILTAVAGQAPWNGRPNGARLSLIAQACQIPSLSIGWLRYWFAAGLGIWLHLGGDGIRLTHAFGSGYGLGWVSGFGPGSKSYPYALGVNLVALALAACLLITSRRSGGKKR